MNTNGVLDGFYEEIMARIKSKVSEVAHIDLYRDQYEHPLVDEAGNPIELPFDVPAALFEWPQEISWELLGMHRKASDIYFNIHLVQEVVQEVDSTTGSTIREKGHLHTSLIDKMQLAIEGFNALLATNFKYFGTIAYTGLKPYVQVGMYTAHIMQFKVRIVNDGGHTNYSFIKDLDPVVTAVDEITTDIDRL